MSQLSRDGKWKMRNLTALCVYFNDTKCCSHISFAWLRRIEAIQWVKWVGFLFFLSHITQTIEYYANAWWRINSFRSSWSLNLVWSFLFVPFRSISTPRGNAHKISSIRFANRLKPIHFTCFNNKLCYLWRVRMVSGNDNIGEYRKMAAFTFYGILTHHFSFCPAVCLVYSCAQQSSH